MSILWTRAQTKNPSRATGTLHISSPYTKFHSITEPPNSDIHFANMPQPSRPKIHIRTATFPADKLIVGQLFLAYAQSLPISLDFQNFEDELAALPGKYAEEQGGAVWLAYSTIASIKSESSTTSDGASTSISKDENKIEKEDEAIGCIAIRPFHYPTTTTSSATLLSKSTFTSPTTTTCELKRLYLTPSSRGSGASKLLMDVALRKARELGYKEMLLDTLRTMTPARKLYEHYGFEECGGYYENPNDACFYRLVL
jgi:GNAT superfamily N-acetyltransferase